MEAATRQDTQHRELVSEIAQLRVFVAVVETGSFSAAARRLGLTLPSISRQVRNIERKLNARLIARTTRRILVTDLGERFYQRCRRVLDELELAEAEIVDYGSEPRGKLKVTAPAVIAVRLLSPFLPCFLKQHPKMAMELVLTSERLDLLKEGIDLSICVGEDFSPGLIVVKLAPNRRIFCASPEYLAAHGEPRSPEELRGHNCLVGRTPTQNNLWPVTIDGRATHIRVNGSFAADNGELLLEAVVNGLGIAMLPTYLTHQQLKAGSITPILARYVAENSWICAVLPHRQFMPPKTRALLDFLKSCFGRGAYWDE